MKSNPIKPFLILLVYVFVFFMLINEKAITIYGLSFGILWKAIVLMGLMTYVILNFGKISSSTFLFVYILFSIKLFINSSFPNHIIEDITSSFAVLFLPFSYYFFSLKYKHNPSKIVNIVIYISVFYLLSSVPYLLNLIQSTNADLTGQEHWGGTDATLLLSGIFFDVSASSKVFVFSTIIILTNYKKFSKTVFKQYMYYILIAIGIVSVYKAFTRTGWIALLIGFTIYLFSKKRINDRLKIIFTIMIIGVIFLIIEQERLYIIQNRIFGRFDVQKKHYSQIDNITSSRSILFNVAFETIKEADFMELFFGYGTTKGKKTFTNYINREMVAHNEFLEIIISGGLTALFLFIWILILIKKLVYVPKNFRAIDVFNTTQNLFILFIFFMIPSHGTPLWCDIMFGGYLAANELMAADNAKSIQY